MTDNLATPSRSLPAPRKVRLVLVVDCEVLDDTWDDAELTDNAVIYFNCMIGDAEERDANLRARDGSPDPYRLSTDAALWTWDNFLADLDEGQVEAILNA